MNVSNVNNTTTSQTQLESAEVINKGFWATLVWAAKVGVRTAGHTLSAGNNLAEAAETWSTLLPQQADDNVKLFNTKRALNIASKLAQVKSDHDKLIVKLGLEENLIMDRDLDVNAFMGLAEEITSDNK